MAENIMDVSILIPVLNESEILSETVARWLMTADGLDISYELLIVDDGSTDETPRLLKELEARHENLRSTRTKGVGQHRALMHGIKQARGKFILTGDADLFPSGADIKRALRACEMGQLAVLRRTKNSTGLRDIASRINNRLVGALRGRAYRDIGSMQLLFPAPPEDFLPEKDSFYLPLLLEKHFERSEFEACIEGIKRPSRYDFKKLLRLMLVELDSMQELPDNRHPQLLAKIKELGVRVLGH